MHPDTRGRFLEFYRYEPLLQSVGHALDVKQVNLSVSSRGVARGIHYALIPPGQAKYVTAVNGSVLDFIVDLRVGSPTFGQWDSVLLDDESHRAVYLAEGLGHAFVTLSDRATVSYLVSEVFTPDRELGINLRDPDIGLIFPMEADPLLLSPKDVEGASLRQAVERGLLPMWDDCISLYSALNVNGS